VPCMMLKINANQVVESNYWIGVNRLILMQESVGNPCPIGCYDDLATV
jgi:hypothetical protein